MVGRNFRKPIKATTSIVSCLILGLAIKPRCKWSSNEREETSDSSWLVMSKGPKGCNEEGRDGGSLYRQVLSLASQSRGKHPMRLGRVVRRPHDRHED